MGRLLLFALLLTAPGFGQIVGASLGGSVKDESGAVLPQASVSVKNVETGAERKLVTDDAGRYSAPSIAAGRYEVTAAKTGFHTQVKTGIELAVGQAVTVDITLSLGEVRQTMVVEEAAAAVEVATADSSGLVSERQVKELPLNGRSYDQLMTLNAGVVNYTGERTGGVGTSNSSVGNMFSVSGRRPQENLFLLNGIEYTGASLINNTPGGTSGQLLGVEAVREFNVVSGNYGAQYGKRPGGQVSIVTAGGTNQFHGTAYEFLRNSAFDARNEFDQPGHIPEFQRNEFGAAAGGPIRRDKLFLFGNYEGFRQNLGLSDVTLVPDNASRASAVPAVQPLLALWPVANGPELGGGIAEAFSNPRQHIREDFGTARFDANLSGKDTLFGVYTVDDSGANTPTVNPLSTVLEYLREQVASVEEQHIFSPSLLNTARFGFSRAGYYFTGQVPVNVPGWVEGAPVGAIVVGGGTASNGASQISLAGANNGSNLSAVRNLFTWDDHVGIMRGRHQITAGVWGQRLQANDNLVQSQYGQASFSSLSSFLQGTIATFSVAPSPTPVGWRQTETAGFVDDSIKLRSNLELRLGFRFESTNGWNESHGRASNYLFDGSVIRTNPQVGDSVFTLNRAKFLPEPRVGLAWDPFGQSKTVIRAGFGIYRALLDNLDYRLDQTAPFNTILALKNVPVAGLQITPGAPAPAGSKISPAGVQPDAFTPTVITWNLKVEQEVARNTSLGVAYTGSHGYHEMLSVDANEPFPSIVNGMLYYPSGAPLANPNVTNTTTWLSEGISAYHALSVDVNRRFGHSFQIRGVYTFSKALDDGTAWNSSVGANAPGFVMYPGNPKLDWGPATTDVRHLGAINGSWDLPYGRAGKTLPQKIFGGWTLSAIETLQSGFPFTAQLGYNPTNNGDSRNPIRPSVNPAFQGPVILGSPNGYFNPNAFLPPASGTYGNVGRDTLTGPGLATLDAALRKTVAVTEKTHLELRAEAFNIFNRANFGTPNAVVFTSAAATPAPTAGVITATSTSSRQVQLGVKLKW